MKIVILTIILLAFAIVLLGVKVFFIKGGNFPSGHVHDIKALQDKNVHCASNQREN